MNSTSFIKYAAMLTLGMACVCSCGKKEDKEAAAAAAAAQQQTPELAVMTATPDTLTMFTAYPATLHGSNDVEIRPQISGFLTHVHVQEGQRVVAGQVLFTIDQVSLQAAVDAAQSQILQAEAAVKVAEANVNTQKTNVNNNKLLVDQNIISKSAYQTTLDALAAAQAQLNQARAGVASARANLTSAQKNLSYSVVRAPESGIIGTIDYKEGALVSPQTLLTVLSGSNDIEAYFSFTEKELLTLTGEAGSVQNALAKMPPVSLQLSNGETYPLQGRVISVSGVLDSSTGSATAKASFPNPDGLLHSGNSAKVLIPQTYTDVITIPQTATFEIQGLTYAYVVDNNGKLTQTQITVSSQSDGKTYIVTGGLEPGQTVLVEGVGMTAKDGMTIKPKTGGEAAQAQ
ncbi:MAG: efflux RND transporter periplasmic adaptor subunit [Prevotella sp.]|nr:efflux RND transporter periplasmic adaptor subunit [Prevotella sp.]MCM1075379.1 efflux RND transporter periplasmic adaptor subunit [Ruminococcus sp.]